MTLPVHLSRVQKTTAQTALRLLTQWPLVILAPDLNAFVPLICDEELWHQKWFKKVKLRILNSTKFLKFIFYFLAQLQTRFDFKQQKWSFDIIKIIKHVDTSYISFCATPSYRSFFLFCLVSRMLPTNEKRWRTCLMSTKMLELLLFQISTTASFHLLTRF